MTNCFMLIMCKTCAEFSCLLLPPWSMRRQTTLTGDGPSRIAHAQANGLAFCGASRSY